LSFRIHDEERRDRDRDPDLDRRPRISDEDSRFRADLDPLPAGNGPGARRINTPRSIRFVSGSTETTPGTHCPDAASITVQG
jgi:hypothetical protein